MGNLRGVLKYRNPDSTVDLNRRLFGAISKGVYDSNAITTTPLVVPVSGQLSVQVLPFVAMSADGMLVTHEGAPTVLTVYAGQTQYVICRARYVNGADPVISLEVISEANYNLPDPDRTYPYLGKNIDLLIILAKINIPGGATAVTNSHIDLRENHIVNSLNRPFIRGALPNQAALPVNPVGGPTVLVTGDVYLCVAERQFYRWNGSTWDTVTDGQLSTDLTNHINAVIDISHPNGAHNASNLKCNPIAGLPGPSIFDTISQLKTYADTNLNTKVSKAGDTMTGALAITGVVGTALNAQGIGATAAIIGNNINTGIGVSGFSASSASGVQGSSSSGSGVLGIGTYGVSGLGPTGVWGRADSASGIGVLGEGNGFYGSIGVVGNGTSGSIGSTGIVGNGGDSSTTAGAAPARGATGTESYGGLSQITSPGTGLAVGGYGVYGEGGDASSNIAGVVTGGIGLVGQGGQATTASFPTLKTGGAGGSFTGGIGYQGGAGIIASGGDKDSSGTGGVGGVFTAGSSSVAVGTAGITSTGGTTTGFNGGSGGTFVGGIGSSFGGEGIKSTGGGSVSSPVTTGGAGGRFVGGRSNGAGVGILGGSGIVSDGGVAVSGNGGIGGEFNGGGFLGDGITTTGGPGIVANGGYPNTLGSGGAGGQFFAGNGSTSLGAPGIYSKGGNTSGNVGGVGGNFIGGDGAVTGGSGITGTGGVGGTNGGTGVSGTSGGVNGHGVKGFGYNNSFTGGGNAIISGSTAAGFTGGSSSITSSGSANTGVALGGIGANIYGGNASSSGVDCSGAVTGGIGAIVLGGNATRASGSSSLTYGGTALSVLGGSSSNYLGGTGISVAGGSGTTQDGVAIDVQSSNYSKAINGVINSGSSGIMFSPHPSAAQVNRGISWYSSGGKASIGLESVNPPTNGGLALYVRGAHLWDSAVRGFYAGSLGNGFTLNTNTWLQLGFHDLVTPSNSIYVQHNMSTTSGILPANSTTFNIPASGRANRLFRITYEISFTTSFLGTCTIGAKCGDTTSGGTALLGSVSRMMAYNPGPNSSQILKHSFLYKLSSTSALNFGVYLCSDVANTTYDGEYGIGAAGSEKLHPYVLIEEIPQAD